MAVAFVRFIRPRPGRRQDLLNVFSRTKRLHERCGGKVRVFAAGTGPNVGAFIHVVETADWKAFGEYRTKIEADSEFRAVMAEIQNARDPLSDLLSAEVSEEIPIG